MSFTIHVVALINLHLGTLIHLDAAVNFTALALNNISLLVYLLNVEILCGWLHIYFILTHSAVHFSSIISFGVILLHFTCHTSKLYNKRVSDQVTPFL